MTSAQRKIMGIRPRARLTIILIPEYPLCGTNQTTHPSGLEIKTVSQLFLFSVLGALFYYLHLSQDK